MKPSLAEKRPVWQIMAGSRKRDWGGVVFGQGLLLEMFLFTERSGGFKNRVIVSLIFPLLFCGPGRVQADTGRVRLALDGTNTLVMVEGDHDDDWRIQASGDLVTWSNLTALGTLLSAGTNPPVRAVGGHDTGRV